MGLCLDEVELFDNLTVCKQISSAILDCKCHITILGTIQLTESKTINVEFLEPFNEVQNLNYCSNSVYADQVKVLSYIKYCF